MMRWWCMKRRARDEEEAQIIMRFWWECSGAGRRAIFCHIMRIGENILLFPHLETTHSLLLIFRHIFRIHSPTSCGFTALLVPKNERSCWEDKQKSRNIEKTRSSLHVSRTYIAEVACDDVVFQVLSARRVLFSSLKHQHFSHAEK